MSISMNLKFKRTPLAAGVLLALSSPVYSPQVIAAQGDKVETEFRANITTLFDQRYPSIAMDADGDFVIAWQANFQDGDGYGVYARRYDADGNSVGNGAALWQVNTEISNNQERPSIAMDADGDFVIAWTSYGQDTSDSNGVYARRYIADDKPFTQDISPAGIEFPVNTFTTGNQDNSSIAMDADGDFVIAWESNLQDGDGDGVYAQRYTADGIKAGSEFQVNTFLANDQNSPSIAMDADGDFVIAWTSFLQDGDVYGIYAQRYTADGIKAGSEFQVNTETSNHQANPSVAMDADGDFVIAWQSNFQDFSNWDVYAQRYSADGTPAGIEFLVNTETSNNQRDSSIAMDADGDFVIAWQSNLQDGDGYGVYAQRYTADGIKAGIEFPVNTFLANDQNSPSIAMDADGDFVSAWSTFEQDLNGWAVYAQRYEGASETVDLNIVLQDSVEAVGAGGSFVSSLITTNNGTGTAMDVSLSATFGYGIYALTYVSDDSASVGWGCAVTGATVNCSKPFMTVGETNTIQVNVKAPDIVPNNYGGRTEVTVEAAQTDANPADNTDIEYTMIYAGDAGGGGGSFSLTPLLLLLPLWIRRRWLG